MDIKMSLISMISIELKLDSSIPSCNHTAKKRTSLAINWDDMRFFIEEGVHS